MNANAVQCKKCGRPAWAADYGGLCSRCEAIRIILRGGQHASAVRLDKPRELPGNKETAVWWDDG